MDLSAQLEHLRDKHSAEHAESVERLARIEAQCIHLDECLDSVKRKLFGNGQPGVVQMLEIRITNLEKWVWRVTGVMATITFIVNLLLLFKRP